MKKREMAAELNIARQGAAAALKQRDAWMDDHARLATECLALQQELDALKEDLKQHRQALYDATDRFDLEISTLNTVVFYMNYQRDRIATVLTGVSPPSELRSAS